MKNKVELKKTIIKMISIIIVTLMILSLYQYYQYKTYTKNFNNKIGSIMSKIEKEYPNVTTNELIEILNSENDINIDLFKSYGITLSKESILLNNNKSFLFFLISTLIIVLIFTLLLLIVFLKYNSNKDKKLKKLQNI